MVHFKTKFLIYYYFVLILFIFLLFCFVLLSSIRLMFEKASTFNPFAAATLFEKKKIKKISKLNWVKKKKAKHWSKGSTSSRHHMH